ncbi:MAG: cytochrome P450 [Dehalococcoidia bacterium]
MNGRRRPPGPKSWLPVGHLFEFRRDPTAFLTKVAREHGDVAIFRLGTRKICLLSHPDYVRDVLVTHQANFTKSRALRMSKRLLGEGLLTSEGQFHLRQRRLAQPAFHKERLTTHSAVMTGYAGQFADRWIDGSTVDMAREMRHLTLAIVGKTLFDADVENDADKVFQALTQTMSLFNRVTSPFAELLDRLPLPSNRRFDQGRERLDVIV